MKQLLVRFRCGVGIIIQCLLHQSNYALKHTYQLCGMTSTLSMRTTISPRQWKPWTAVSPSLAIGLVSMA